MAFFTWCAIWEAIHTTKTRCIGVCESVLYVLDAEGGCGHLLLHCSSTHQLVSSIFKKKKYILHCSFSMELCAIIYSMGYRGCSNWNVLPLKKKLGKKITRLFEHAANQYLALTSLFQLFFWCEEIITFCRWSDGFYGFLNGIPFLKLTLSWWPTIEFKLPERLLSVI